MPDFSSSAIRRAMIVCGSIVGGSIGHSRICDEIVDERAQASRRDRGPDTPTGTMLSELTMTVSAAIAITGLKLRAVSA